MHIRSLDPANMKGHAGGMIQTFDAYWRQYGRFTLSNPFHQQQLWYRTECDGESLPHMFRMGRRSFLNEIMDGQFGEDYAASVKAQDPSYVRAVSAAFPRAATGRPVFDLIEIEVTPPGHSRPYYVEYLRGIHQFDILKGQALSVLVVPTDAWRAQFLRTTELGDEMLSRTRNSTFSWARPGVRSTFPPFQ